MKKLMTFAAIAAIALGAAILTSCDNGGDGPDDKPEYTVTFDADGGSPAPAAQKVKAGETATAPATVTKTGYAFLFWSLNGTSAYNFSAPVNGNITLTAHWKADATVEYWQVSWVLNGGAWPEGDNHATQVVKGGTLAEPAAPTKEGGTFDGWYKEEALTGKITFPYDVSALTADFTLYAGWKTAGEAITVPDESELTQEIYADETKAGIAFTATEEWTVTAGEITTTRSEFVSWINFDKTSGGPGQHNLGLTLDPNGTGKDRKSWIQISSISSSVRVEITQFAAKKPGEGSKRVVAQITGGEAGLDFFYDDHGKVMRIENNGGDLDYTFYHRPTGEILFSTDEGDGRLDMQDGRITRWSLTDEDGDVWDDHKVSYDNGRLKSIVGYIPDEYTFTWTGAGGNMTKTVHKMTWGHYDEPVKYYDAGFTTFGYWDIPNNPDCNLDLNGMALMNIIDYTEPYWGPLMGLFGNRSAQLIKTINTVLYNKDDDTGKEEIIYTGNYSYTYDINPAGFVTKITETVNYTDSEEGNGSYKEEYHIVYR